jgi:hypothetical protein
MKRETARDLLGKCVASIRSGDDFPTVWATILKRDPLVLGPPVSTIKDGRARLEVFLVTGQRLVFDSESKVFSLS